MSFFFFSFASLPAVFLHSYFSLRQLNHVIIISTIILCFFLLLLFLLCCHSCCCTSELESFCKSLKHFSFLQWRKGLHERERERERRPSTGLSYLSLRVTVTMFLIVRPRECIICSHVRGGGGRAGLKRTDMSRLPH